MSERNTSLSLTRPVGMSVVIRVGDEVVRVTVTDITTTRGRAQARLRFDAPPCVQINREEIDIVKFGDEDSPPEV